MRESSFQSNCELSSEDVRKFLSKSGYVNVEAARVIQPSSRARVDVSNGVFRRPK